MADFPSRCTRILLALAAALAAGCAHTLPQERETPAPVVAAAPSVAPVAIAATARPVSAPEGQGSTEQPTAAATETRPAPVVPASELPSSYVVRPGDTLAQIARRAEVYGDSALWPLLYHANADQIASVDWLCPGQVLAVPRTFSDAEASLARERSRQRAPWPPGAKASPTYLCRDGPAKQSGGATAAADAAAVRAPSRPAPVEAVAASGKSEARKRPAAPAAGVDKSPDGRSGKSAAGESAAAESAPATPAPVTAGAGRNAYREAARRAQAVGDLAWAIHYYRRHLAEHPRDPDALVELGNIYYRSGDRQRAASLYYDAARLLIQAGNRARATRLMAALAADNPALANDLYLRLSAPPLR